MLKGLKNKHAHWQTKFAAAPISTATPVFETKTLFGKMGLVCATMVERGRNVSRWGSRTDISFLLTDLMPFVF